jgi:hypothetical protein
MYSFSDTFRSSTTRPVGYPSTLANRGGYFQSMFASPVLPVWLDKKSNTRGLCYTQSKGTFMYKSHSAYGAIGTSATAYLAQRGKL